MPRISPTAKPNVIFSGLFVVLASLVVFSPAGVTTSYTDSGPATSTPSILGQHVVQRGETLYCLGRAYGVQPDAIANANGVSRIFPGQVLNIPAVQWVNIPPGPICMTQFLSPFPGLSIVSTTLPNPTSTEGAPIQADKLAQEGEDLLDRSDFQGAFERFASALALYQKEGDRPGQAHALDGMGEARYGMSEFQEASALIQQSLSIQREIGDRKGEATSVNDLAVIYYATSEYDNAVSFAQQAFKIAKEINDIENQATALVTIGSAYFGFGDYDLALEQFEQAASLWHQINHKEGEATTLSNIGAIYLYLADYSKALEYYQEALPILQELGNRATEAIVFNSIGEVYNKLGQYADAISNYERALAIQQDIGDRDGQATTLNNLGTIYENQGKYRQALSYYEKSLDIARAISDPDLEAVDLSNIGGIYHDFGQYDEALTYYQQTLTLDTTLDNKNGQAIVLNNIGFLYDTIGNHKQALDNFTKALQIEQEIEDREGEATTLNNIAGVYDDLGHYQEALINFQRALSITQEIEYKTLTGKILNNMGNIFADIGNLDQARRYLQQSLDIRRSIGDQAGEATTLSNLGSVYNDQGDGKQALTYLEQALVLWKEIGSASGEASTLHNIGTVYRHLKDFDQALNYYNQSLSLDQKIGEPEGQASALDSIGLVLVDKNRALEAIEYYRQALVIEREVGDRRSEARTLGNMGRAYEQQGNLSAALEHYQTSVEVFEAVQGEVKIEAFQASLGAQEADVYKYLIRLLVATGQEEKAFDYSERGRARAFLNTLGNVRLDVRAGAAGLLDQEQNLRGELIAVEQSLLAEKSKPLGEQNDEVVESLSDQLNTKQQQYEDLLDQLQLSNPELTSLVTVAPLTLSEIQALLDKATTLVSYYLTDQKALAWIVTAKTFRVVELPATSEQLRVAVQDFRVVGLSNPDLSDQHPATLVQLHQWLIAPIQPYLITPLVIIVPHGVLNYLPFAALSDGKTYFSDQFALVNLPSASTFQFVLQKRKNQPASVLAFGYNQPQGLPVLKYAEAEAQATAALYSTVAYVGKDATEANFRTKVTEAEAVLLSAHGELNLPNPMFSRIWLAGIGQTGNTDGALEVNEIYGLDLSRASVVVLSACDTGRGKLIEGDELIGLNRAFMVAGASSVVTTLWQVDDEAAKLLTTRFFSHIKEGLGPAGALRLAQADVRARYPHPYYWAAFAVTGDPGVNLPSIQSSSGFSPTQQALFLSLGVLVLLAIVLMLVRKKKRL